MFSFVLLVSLSVPCESAFPPRWEHHRIRHSSWTFEYRFYNQTLNHFSSYDQDRKFRQRYLIDRSFWEGAGMRSPIFFFTGAEGGDVALVAGAYGHIREMAQRMRGLVVFMEARFFGKSLPLEPSSTDTPDAKHIGHLSVEQILADYAAIISAVRDELDPSWTCPTITFGGSLAGTLSAMMRLRYPATVDMSLASSAPLLGYPLPQVDQFAWRKQVTMNWESLSTPIQCPIATFVRSGFVALASADPEAVRRAFNTCEEPYAHNWLDVRDVIWGILEGTAEFVYPASTSPIPKMCQAAARVAADPDKSSLDIFAALALTSNPTCLNLTQSRARLQQVDAKGWDYLSCTEIVHPIGCNNVTDFFPPSNWSIKSTGAYCQDKWSTRPINDGLWIPQSFGFAHQARFAKSTSRILFTYGELDPWHVFAIGNQALAPEIPVLMIPGGSHCADMAGNQPLDTPDMKAAREKVEDILDAWIYAVQAQVADATQTIYA